jgi:hypothetical protein
MNHRKQVATATESYKINHTYTKIGTNKKKMKKSILAPRWVLKVKPCFEEEEEEEGENCDL